MGPQQTGFTSARRLSPREPAAVEYFDFQYDGSGQHGQCCLSRRQDMSCSSPVMMGRQIDRQATGRADRFPGRRRWIAYEGMRPRASSCAVDPDGVRIGSRVPTSTTPYSGHNSGRIRGPVYQPRFVSAPNRPTADTSHPQKWAGPTTWDRPRALGERWCYGMKRQSRLYGLPLATANVGDTP